jgi:hypothetical protein
MCTRGAAAAKILRVAGVFIVAGRVSVVMTHTRRQALALAGAGLAALAGCTGSTTTNDPGDENPTATQVPTTEEGVTVRVVNRSLSIRSVRVDGVGDGTIVSLSPGNGFNAGAMAVPVEGEIAYQLAVFADGERVGERSVTVAAGTDLQRVEAELSGDSLSWTEVRGTTEA